MKRELVFDNGNSIIEGEIMRDIVEIFPSLKDQFKQRKNYDEYYYTSKEVYLTIDLIEMITSNGFYSVEINNGQIIIY